MSDLTVERLRELFDYDRKTGVFTRKIAPGKRTDLVGTIAGTPMSSGHLSIKIDGRQYLAHRLAWLYVKGEWPRHQVDHRNRVRSDNRFKNLREATNLQNSRNRSRHRSNKSGYVGVHWSERLRKWVAQIRYGGKKKHLGHFDTAELASEFYQLAADLLFGDFRATTEHS